jgi:tRNA pseudouridine55 synthase
MYSALKQNGKRLYKLAREGITIERPGRPTTIYSIEMEGFESPVVILKVECAKGTYIRSLAHDLGQRLGCGARVETLERLGYGPFDIQDAITLEDLEDAFANGLWQELVHPMDSVLQDWPSLVANEEQAKVIRNGGSLAADDLSGLEGRSRCRVYDEAGGFIAILQYDEAYSRWQSEKVFA